MMSTEVQLTQLRKRWQMLQNGCPLQSEIQMCDFLGEHHLGIAVYEALPQPSQHDHRWVGHCFNAVGQRERAKECFLKAMFYGNRGARVDLVLTQALLGDVDAAQQELLNIEPETLEPLDRVLFFRNQGFVKVMLEKHRSALEDLERSWRELQGLPEFRFIAPRVLIRLGILYHTLRQKEKSLYFLERAEQICVNDLIWSIKLSKGIVQLENGHFAESLTTMLDVESEAPSKIPVITAKMSIARIYVSRHDFEKAISVYIEALEVCKQIVENNLKSIIESDLCFIYTHLKNDIKAREFLYLSEKSAKSEIYVILCKLRKAFYLYKTGRIGGEQAIDDIREVLALQGMDEDLLEHVRFRMYLCEVMLDSGHPEAQSQVDELIDIMLKHDCKYYAYEDLRLLQALYRVLQPVFDHPVVSSNPPVIHLVTIDQEALTFEGAHLNVPLRKTIEVLSFLMYRRSATINEIVLHVFGDLPRDTARNHFHQIRHLLNHKVQKVTIGFDKATKRYALDQYAQIAWDMEALLQQGKGLYGVFLPSSGSDWVIELNQRLSH